MVTTTGRTIAARVIAGKPGPVRMVLTAWMTRHSLHDQDPDMDALAVAALEWWRMVLDSTARLYATAECGMPPSEMVTAERLITLLRDQPVWGKILRDL